MCVGEGPASLFSGLPPPLQLNQGIPTGGWRRPLGERTLSKYACCRNSACDAEWLVGMFCFSWSFLVQYSAHAAEEGEEETRRSRARTRDAQGIARSPHDHTIRTAYIQKYKHRVLTKAALARSFRLPPIPIRLVNIHLIHP